MYYYRKAIHIGSEFILVNLKTKERKRYYIEQSYTKDEPQFKGKGSWRYPTVRTTISNAGKTTNSGATIISQDSPIAKACLTAQEKDTVFVVVNNNKTAYCVEKIIK